MATKPQTDPQHKMTVVKSAILSRIILTALTILWTSLLRPYDTSASINPNCLSSSSSYSSFSHNKKQALIWMPRVASAIEESIVWDSVYFVRIAECGYEYEHYFAFFPLLPLSIYLLSHSVFAPLVPLIGYRAVLGLSGYAINSVSFVLAAIYLYRLSLFILKDEKGAVRAAILFCFNPASVFYSSMSNGVINAGYICYQTMHKAFDAVFCKRNFFLAVQVLTAGALSCLCILIPFVAFQAYGYKNICVGLDKDEPSPWCKARLPLLYNYVQSRYWGVGFLRYFELKQLPNFLLASPILSLAVGAITFYIKLSPRSIFSLGFKDSPEDRRSPLSSHNEVVLSSKGDNFKKESSTTGQGDYILRRRKQTFKGNQPVIVLTGDQSYHILQRSSFFIVPVIFHLAFLTATAFFVMYVQVSTRFLSASPPLYWFASYLTASSWMGKRLGYMIWTYSVAYILLGSLLFSNFYPFT